MPYVGFSGVADQANTSDGFARRTSAKNNPADSVFGDDVGDGGVVDELGAVLDPVELLVGDLCA